MEAERRSSIVSRLRSADDQAMSPTPTVRSMPTLRWRVTRIFSAGLGVALLASCASHVDHQAHRDLRSRWSADAGGLRKPVSELQGTFRNEAHTSLWHVFVDPPRKEGQAVRLEPISSDQLQVTLLKDGHTVATSRATLRILEGCWSVGNRVDWDGTPLSYGTHDDECYLRLDADRNLEVAYSSNGVVRFMGGLGSMPYGRTLEHRSIHRRIAD